MFDATKRDIQQLLLYNNNVTYSKNDTFVMNQHTIW